MKNLRKFLCLILIVPVVLLFAGCGSKNNNNGTGNDGTNQETKLTNKEILKLAYQTFDSQSKTQISGKDSFSSETEDGYVYEDYDKYVYAGVKMLDEIANVTDIVENNWYSGNVETLEGKTGYVNKVSKFLMMTNEDIGMTQIMIKMQMMIQGVNFSENQETFNNYLITVNYSHVTKNIYFDILIEKSRNSGKSGESLSEYYTISYDSNHIIVSSFKRNSVIDYEEDISLINPLTISDYEAFRMNIVNNEIIYETEGFNGEQTIRNDIQEKLIKFGNLKNEFSGFEPLFNSEQITQKIIMLVNAEKISDFMSAD